MRIFKHCFIAILGVLCFNVHAALEQVSETRKGEEIRNAAITLTDQYMNTTTGVVRGSAFYLRLFHNDVEKIYYPNGWNMDVNYSVVLTYYDNSTASETGTLHIEHNTASPDQNIGLVLYKGVKKATVSITGLSFKDGLNNTINTIPDDFHLEGSLETERYFDLDAATAPAIASVNPTLNNEIEICWEYLQGAEGYELEWVYVSDGSETAANPPSPDIAYSFKNATRVDVQTTCYRLSLAYPKGYIMYRVRGYGYDLSAGSTFTYFDYSPWSYNPTPANQMVGQASTDHATTSCYYYTNGTDAGINWTYTASYAEDGKRKEVAAYFDGSGRNRQSVTLVNSDNNAVVAETKYDLPGRAAVNILPAPTASQGVRFYGNANGNWDYQNFATDDHLNGNNAVLPEALPAGSVASTYYSANNSMGFTNKKTVPNAQGYPYSFTQFSNDGLNRPVVSAGVGGTLRYKAQGGHNTKYFYGVPNQVELDRLFGNEAGYAAYYQKNRVIDPNGQQSVQYIDAQGRTVATALAGLPPVNLDTLPSNKSNELVYTQIFTGPKDPGSAPSVQQRFDFMSLSQDSIFLNYRLDTTVFKSCLQTGMPDTLAPIAYDVFIGIKDSRDSTILDTTLLDTSGIDEAPIYSFLGDIDNYVVSRTIAVNQVAKEAYLAREDSLLEYFREDTTTCGPKYNISADTLCEELSCDSLCLLSYSYEENGILYLLDTNGVVYEPVDPLLPNGLYREKDNPGAGTYARTTPDFPHVIALEACLKDCATFKDTSTSGGADVVQFYEEDRCAIKFDRLVDDMTPGNGFMENCTRFYYQILPGYDNVTFVPGHVDTASYRTISNNNTFPGGSAQHTEIYNLTVVDSNRFWVSVNLGDTIDFFSFSNLFVIDNNGDTTQGLDDMRLYLAEVEIDCERNCTEYYCYEVTPIGGQSWPSDSVADGTIDTLEIIRGSGSVTDTILYNVRVENNLICLPFSVGPSAEFTSYWNNGGHVYIADNGQSVFLHHNLYFVSNSVQCHTDTSNSNANLTQANTLLGTSYASWADLYANWQPSYAELLLPLHPEYCAYQYFCNYSENCSPSGTLTMKEISGYQGAMYLPGTFAEAKNYTYEGVAYNFLNPLALSPASSAGTTSDNSSYFASVDGSALARDVLFDCNYLNTTKLSGYAYAQIKDNLQHFLPVKLSNGTTNGHYSIWYLLNDPDGIATVNGGNNAGLHADVVSAFNAIHGDQDCKPGAASPGFQKYTFFRNIYSFFREKAIQDYFDNVYTGCDGNLYTFWDGDSDYDGRIDATGFRLSYPKNIAFALYDDPTNSGLLGNVQASSTSLNAAADTTINDTCSCDNFQAYLDTKGLTMASNATIATAMSNDFCSTYSSADVENFKQCINGNSYAALSLLPDSLRCSFSLIYNPSPDEDCAANKARLAREEADRQWAIAKAAYLDSLAAAYDSVAWYVLETKEIVSLGYRFSEYHYTLYYYDQAGNLIKTVPPAGVDTLSRDEIDSVQANRTANNGVLLRPDHTYVTNYKYNAQNQLVEQHTPDGGKTEFWYDALGRLVISQNARQRAAGDYSYTLYDGLGRIVEVGEVDNPSGSAATAADGGSAAMKTWLTGSARRDVVFTLYDQALEALPGTGATQQAIKNAFPDVFQNNLRNRVAGSFFVGSITGTPYISGNSVEGTLPSGYLNYVHAYHYDYDEHGNVATLVQEIPELTSFDRRFVGLEYSYDLISGNVKEVRFQEGKAEQFFHKYQYDADNRITRVQTSRDGMIWENDANYYYLPHGPLTRTEIGDMKVQGLDYAYTLQGWLKTANGASLSKDGVWGSKEIGRDGQSGLVNAVFAPDVMGFRLDYFNGDFSPIINGFYNTNMAGGHAIAQNTRDLYNGNIARMTTAFWDNAETHVDAGINTYRYDQLNRITAFQAFKDESIDKFNTIGSPSEAGYRTAYAYDPNGNIEALGRYDASGSQFDTLTYFYDNDTTNTSVPLRNRLLLVTDAASSPGLNSDLENQTATLDVTDYSGANNYQYDPSGNLVRDDAEEIASIGWNVAGKIQSISRTSGSTRQNLAFAYDAMGNRFMKKVLNASTQNAEYADYYLRDASGNILAVYKRDYSGGADKLSLSELNVFGSDRLGVISDTVSLQGGGGIASKTVGGLEATIHTTQRTIGQKQYELKNHLGNVLATVSDKKTWKTATENSELLNESYQDPGTGGDWNSTTFASFETGAGDPQGGLVNYQKVNEGVSRTLTSIDPDCSYTLCFDLLALSGAGINLTLFNDQQEIIFTTPDPLQETEATYCFEVDGSEGGTSLTVALSSTDDEGSFIFDNVIVTQTCTRNQQVADVITAQDYYPFGMQMPGRIFQGSDGYRYGFNGKEMDNEVSGNGNQYDYGFRIYNPRIAKFLSVDPLTASYPWLTPYQFAQNDPIRNIDIDGLEGGSVVEYLMNEGNRAVDKFKNWLGSLSLLPSTSPSAPAPPVNDDPAKPELEKITCNEVEEKCESNNTPEAKKNIDLRDNVNWVSQFDSRFGSKKEQKVACCRASKATLSDYGIKNPGPNTTSTVIQTARENDGALEITEDARAGIDHINSELEAGNPVIVGVNHTLGNTYNEGTTDHFVVIVGRGTDEGGNAFYNFYEVGTSREGSGTSNKNRFTLNSDNSLTGSPEYSEKKRYTVSQVRKNGNQQ